MTRISASTFHYPVEVGLEKCNIYKKKQTIISCLQPSINNTVHTQNTKGFFDSGSKDVIKRFFPSGNLYTANKRRNNNEKHGQAASAETCLRCPVINYAVKRRRKELTTARHEWKSSIAIGIQLPPIGSFIYLWRGTRSKLFPELY